MKVLFQKVYFTLQLQSIVGIVGMALCEKEHLAHCAGCNFSNQPVQLLSEPSLLTLQLYFDPLIISAYTGVFDQIERMCRLT